MFSIKVYENLEDYDPVKKRKILVVFDDMQQMKTIKQPKPIVTELIIRERKRNISLVFIPQSYFIVSKIQG